MKPIICKYCKSIAPESASFCPKCGQEFGVNVCVACGAEIPRDASFCPKCGQEFGVNVCVACGAEVSRDASFCLKCGRKIGIYACATCGAEIPRDASFCPKCGKEMINQLSSKPVPTTPHLESIPQPLSNVVAKAPVPSISTEQNPFPRGKKRRIGLIIFIILLVAICVAGVAIFYISNLNRQVTSEENGELWASANTILSTFVGDNLSKFAGAETSPISSEKMDQIMQQISDFDTALKALEAVKPPPDQVIVQEMLLPMYRRIYNQMITIKDALVAGDPLKVDLEVQRLQVLLDELGGALDMLTFKTVPDQTMTLMLANGERTGTYMGEMVDGLPNGYGKFTSANSEGVEWTYEGQWAAGHFFGQGTLVLENGFSTGGWYEKDLLNGEGWESWYGIVQYEGEYLDDEYHGQGTYYNYHGEIVYSGAFYNGIIQESAQNRLARVGAFKDQCIPSTAAELYSACQSEISVQAQVSGEIFQTFYYPESNPTYCEIRLYENGINSSDTVINIYYTLSEGEIVPVEGQTVTVWGTTEYLYSYTTYDGDYLTVPLLMAWSVE